MKRRRGFTLAEIMVVMTLIAVITSLAGVFLKDVFDSYMADQAAQTVLTAIRDAQNRAIAVQDGKKVWAASISAMPDGAANGGELKILSYEPQVLDKTKLSSPATALSDNLKAYSVTLYGQVNNITENESYSNINDSFVFAFASPFGRAGFFHGGSGLLNSIKSDCTDAYVPTPGGSECLWKKTNNFLDEWYLEITDRDTTKPHTVIGSPNEEARIVIKYGRSVREVVVRSNGETSVE